MSTPVRKELSSGGMPGVRLSCGGESGHCHLRGYLCCVVADTVIHLSYPLAFLAGLVSFLSPCVFPLVPAYLGYLGGRAGEPAAVFSGGGGQATGVMRSGTQVPLMANGVAFVLGFSAVFITFFYVLQALGSAVITGHHRLVDVVAGSVIVLLGLQTLGVFRVGFLMRERRHMVMPAQAGLVPSFVLGLTFAAGWTPCIGPQLGAILTVAQQGDFAGLPVMLAYCLGLAVPFLVVAALADRLQDRIRALNRHVGAVNLVAGALLLTFGLMLIAGSFTVLNRFAASSPFSL